VASTHESSSGCHRFTKPELLRRALTHRSYSANNNERLEFLGDSVVNCAVALELFHKFPHLTEGELSRARSDESLGAGRGRLATLEAEQERAREARLHWQVQEAHIGARVRTAGERLERALLTIGEAGSAGTALGEEVERLVQETTTLSSSAPGRSAARGSRQLTPGPGLAAAEAEAGLAAADQGLVARNASWPTSGPRASS
jgi:hypothetical protein